jgi:lysozyme
VSRQRVLVAALSLSLVGFASWQASEGWTDTPVIPTKGDRPTIGHGSTFYEDGTPVKLTDPPITRERGEVLARNLLSKDEKALAASLPGAKLYPEEHAEYLDFIGQYGSGTWRKSSMRRHVMAGEYVQACNALLRYRFAAGYDCSTPGNRRCSGVWTRQLERHRKCLEAQ